MKTLMLATVASIALSLPAMAQSNNAQPMNPNQAQSQPQTQQQAQNTVDPSQLKPQQVRQIQQALEQKGAPIKHADGKWGPQTEAALKKFQQKQNIQGNGKLDQQTMAALGVNMNAQGRQEQGSATTGSGSRESRMNRPSQNPGPTHSGASGQSTPQANSGSDTGGQNGANNPAVNDGH